MADFSNGNDETKKEAIKKREREFLELGKTSLELEYIAKTLIRKYSVYNTNEIYAYLKRAFLETENMVLIK